MPIAFYAFLGFPNFNKKRALGTLEQSSLAVYALFLAMALFKRKSNSTRLTGKLTKELIMETYIPSLYEEMLNKALSIVARVNKESRRCLLPELAVGVYLPQWMHDEKIAALKADLVYCSSFLTEDDNNAIKELLL